MSPAFLARVTIGTLLAALSVAVVLGFVLVAVHRTEVERSATEAAIGQAARLLTPSLETLQRPGDIASIDRSKLAAVLHLVQTLPDVDDADFLTTTGRSVLTPEAARDSDAAQAIRDRNVHASLVASAGSLVHAIEIPVADTNGRYLGVLRINLDETQIDADARSQNVFIFTATIGAMAVIIGAFFALAVFTLPRIIRQQRELERTARTDSLTGLVNRVAFHQEIQDFIQRAVATHERCGVLLIDLDRFKEVNDTLGHQAGDAVLLLTAQRLISAVRTDEVVARLGGDEFAILAPGLDAAAAEHLADRVGASLRTPFDVYGRLLRLSSSIGVATFPRDAQTLDELLARADQAMYAAKQAGRDRHSTYATDLGERRSTEERFVAALRASIKNDEMMVWYQPEVTMVTRRPFGLEALLRWNSPAYGLTLPEAFIEDARKCGFLTELLTWTIRTVCRDIRRLAKAGHVMRVFINVTPDEMMDDALQSTIFTALNDFGVPAILLGLELIERYPVENLDMLAQRMWGLREQGIALALDDFGVGYSSLARFKALPLDVLKIDQSYVQGVLHGDVDRAVLTACALLARELELPVIVEGVESDEQHSVLSAIGFERAQGFLYARPMPVEMLETYLASLTTLIAS